MTRGPGGSLAAKVDGLRQLGLAHLLFPSQQDGALSPGRLAGVAQQFAHGARLPTGAESSGTVWRS